MSQRRDAELRHFPERVAELSRREHQRDLLRDQTASHEHARTRRSVVEPLGVVNRAYERLLLSRLGEQLEHRQPDKRRCRGLSGSKSERDAERVVLTIRQVLQKPIEDHALAPASKQPHTPNLSVGHVANNT